MRDESRSLDWMVRDHHQEQLRQGVGLEWKIDGFLAQASCGLLSSQSGASAGRCDQSACSVWDLNIPDVEKACYNNQKSNLLYENNKFSSPDKLSGSYLN